MGYPNFDEPAGVSIKTQRKKLDLFFDLQCPYSKKSWDTIGKSIAEKWTDSVDIAFHFICLSHHRQSWDLTRAMFAVRSIDLNKTFQFIDFIYGNHAQFYNAEWAGKGQGDFLKHVSELIAPLVGVQPGKFQEVLSHDDTFSEAKKSIRYAAVNQVWSTPTVILNGSQRDDLDSSSVIADWEKVLGG